MQDLNAQGHDMLIGETEQGNEFSAARGTRPVSSPKKRLGEIAVLAAIALLAVLALYIPTTWIGDLGPVPDAQEYAITAGRLAHGASYSISLLGRQYPPRYPFGFPALLVPAYWLPDATLGNGIYAVVTYGVLTVVLAYTLAAVIGGPVAGVVAAVTLMALPEFQLWNHELMSETASAALTLTVALLLYQAVTAQDQSRRFQLLIAAGLVSGAAVLVHLTDIALVAAIITVLPASAVLRRQLVRNLAAVSVGPIMAMASLAIYDRLTFGSFTRTGYEFWVPNWYSSPGTEFSTSYALKSPGISDPATPGLSNVSYYLGAFTGLSWFHSISVIPTTFALLAVAGTVLMVFRSQPAVRCVALFCIVVSALTLVTFSLYFFQAARFVAPVVPLFAVAAGVGAGKGISLAIEGWRRHSLPQGIVGVGLCALLAAMIRDSIRGSVQQNYLYQSTVAKAQPVGQWNLWTAALYGRAIHGRSIVITDTLLPLLDQAGLSRRTRVIPVSRGEYWDKPPLQNRPLYSSEWRHIDQLIRRGIPVYSDSPTLAAARGNTAADHSSWAALDSHRLIPVASYGAVVIYRLAMAP